MDTSQPDDLLARLVAAKVRRHIVPLFMAVWFVAYIDRFNVSYAALQMNAQIGLSPARFGLGSGLFFLGYALFEVPSNMMLVRVGARRWLARIIVSWGLVTMAMIWTRGPSSFAALRLILGIAEAGCFPGMAFCLSQWLAPRDRAGALAALGSVAMVSGIVGGPLAAGLLTLRGVAGLAGWQWLFLLEGIPAVAIGICVWRYLPDSPHHAAWLTPEERRWLTTREDPRCTERSRGAFRVVIANPRYWQWGLAFFCAAAAGSATLLFRPIILKQMAGLDDTFTAILAGVPAMAGAIATVYVGQRSTRVDERRWHAGVPMLLGASGVAAGGVAHGLGAALAVASLATVSAASQPPLFASVSAEGSSRVNAVGIAFVNSIASVGGFLGPYAMGYLIDRTGDLVVPCAIAGIVLAIGACLVVAGPDTASVRSRRSVAAPSQA